MNGPAILTAVSAHQPGGWIYNMLPWSNMNMVHDIAKGVPGDFDTVTPTSKYNTLAAAKAACIPFLLCPVRRKPISYPSVEPSWNCAQWATTNKTDYAANGGSVQFLGTGPATNWNCYNTFPACYSPGNPDPDSGWTAVGYPSLSLATNFNGVSGERSEVQPGHITDGLSNVFLAGEKYLNSQSYYTGADGADNDTCLEGNDWDVNRWVPGGGAMPIQDTAGVGACSGSFGSAHPQGLHFVFCDGSVHLVSYKIDAATYTSLGVRNDGTPTEATGLW